MIKVYICEDNQKQLEKIRDAVNNTIMIEDLDMRVEKSTKDPFELIELVKENEGTGIYFLDIDLGADINGIQLGEKIRQLDPTGYIIFVTTHAELSHLTFKYKVEALDYIIKDDFKEVSKRVKECILYANDKYMALNGERNEVFYINSNDKVVLSEFKNIIAFETSPTVHKIIMNSDKRQVEFYGSMKEVESKLDDQFIRCHKSFIINKNKIRIVDKKNRIAHMVNGQECLISIRGLKLLNK